MKFPLKRGSHFLPRSQRNRIWKALATCLLTLVTLGGDEVFAQSPVRQHSYLKSPVPGVSDRFGGAIAICGNRLVVGGWHSTAGATHRNQVHVFELRAGTWQLEATLEPSNLSQNFNFGSSVAISDNFLTVGAPGEGNAGVGVNPPQNAGVSSRSGAAYIVHRVGGIWVQEAYLKASNADAQDSLGHNVAIRDGRAVVTARYEASSATGIGGDPSLNDAPNAGAAYSFRRVAGVWSQDAYIKASNTDGNDFFGESVALGDQTILIGAMGESSNAVGVNGDQSNNDAFAKGAAYVFETQAGSWAQVAYFKSDGLPSDQLGLSVGLQGDTAVCGGWDRPADVYRRASSGWVWESDLERPASHNSGLGLFGGGVAVFDDRILVADTESESRSLGVNPNPLPFNCPASGSVYSYTRSGTTWSSEHFFKASNAGGSDVFGTSIALNGTYGLIGAFLEDSNRGMRVEPPTRMISCS